MISAVNEYDGEEMLNLLLVDDRIPAGAKLYYILKGLSIRGIKK